MKGSGLALTLARNVIVRFRRTTTRAAELRQKEMTDVIPHMAGAMPLV